MKLLHVKQFKVLYKKTGEICLVTKIEWNCDGRVEYVTIYSKNENCEIELKPKWSKYEFVSD